MRHWKKFRLSPVSRVPVRRRFFVAASSSRQLLQVEAPELRSTGQRVKIELFT
jgi:hypothetical protein